MRAEELARQGLLRYVAVLGAGIAGGMTTRELFSLLDAGLQALAPRREAFERAEAEAWLEQQQRVLKPRRPRLTQEVYRRALVGDPEAQALIAQRRAEQRAGRRRKVVPA